MNLPECMDSLVAGVRYALRMIRKTPGASAVAILSLALGIGANTAIFTLIDAVMLKMLPVKEPEQLALLNYAAKEWPKPFINSMNGSMNNEGGRFTSTSFSYRTFQEIHDRNKAFSSVFGFASIGRVNVGANGEAGLAAAQVVTGEYFSGLGVQPIAGRALTADDDRQAAPPVAVISYGYWQSRFGGDRSIVGKAITVNGVASTIIGVTPPEFFGLSPGSSIDISLPLTLRPQLTPGPDGPDPSWLGDSTYWWVLIMGRLKTGVTAREAVAGVDAIFKQSITTGLGAPPGKDAIWPTIELGPASQGLDFLRRQFSKPLWVLMTVVGLVLLIACTNVANLLLSRAAARQKEIAVRLSMGATRARLVRQLLLESVLLASLGGLLGLAVAYWGSNVLVGFMSRTDAQMLLDLHPDLKVLGFTAAVCLLTGLLFGLAPGLRATRLDLTSALKQNARTLSLGRLRLGLPKILVVSQVALSLVLLFGAGLFVRTLVNLQNVSVGFRVDNLLIFGVNAFQSGYKGAAQANLYDRIQERLRLLPGIKSVSMSHMTLLANSMTSHGITVPGYVAKPGERTSVRMLDVGTDFFETLGIPLMLGRTSGPRDDEARPKVAVINQAMARQFFGSENPVGKRFGVGRGASDIEIVGVVKNAKYESVRREDPPIIYTPYRQSLSNLRFMTFAIRTSSSPSAVISAVRGAVHSIDPNLPLYNVKTQQAQLDEILLQERLFAKLSSFFGFLALLLACVGLYGTMSYAVERRIWEIGVRMALGAHRLNIFGMILRETVIMVIAGVIIGVAAALTASRYVASVISGMLFGLKVGDAATLSIAAAVLIAIAVAAGLVPARRASRIAPMTALRTE
jgi:predicted permease